MTYDQLQWMYETGTVGLILRYDELEVVRFDPDKTDIRGVDIELVTALYQPFSEIGKVDQYALWFPRTKEMIV